MMAVRPAARLPIPPLPIKERPGLSTGTHRFNPRPREGATLRTNKRPEQWLDTTLEGKVRAAVNVDLIVMSSLIQNKLTPTRRVVKLILGWTRGISDCCQGPFLGSKRVNRKTTLWG